MMSRSGNRMMIGIVATAFVFLLAATASNVHAWGEGGHAPEGMHLKGPALHGVLTATYIPVDYIDCSSDPYGCVKVSFTVKCKSSSGVTFNVSKDLQKNVYEYTEADIDNLIFQGAGPPGCASVDGGEDLVVKQVFRFSNTFGPGNLGAAINAEMFLLYVVDYSVSNPVQ